MQISDEFAAESGLGYTWEAEYEKSWEALQEDEIGDLQSSIDKIVAEKALAKRRLLLRQRLPKNIRLGMTRCLVLVIDQSRWMVERDLRPTRLGCCCKLIPDFIRQFFSQNPVSQLSTVVSKDGRANLTSPMIAQIQKHVKCVEALKPTDCSGDISLQNSLEMSIRLLKHVPSHMNKEILVITGSLNTCDPDNINITIQKTIDEGIRCSIISLSAEVYIFKHLAKSTQGSYDVCIDESHFRDLLLYHTNPPPSKPGHEASLIKMGFPIYSVESQPALCLCHIDQDLSEIELLSKPTFSCPQCASRYCEVPIECKGCGLTLISASHLARSYQHLFPVPPFEEREFRFDAITSSDPSMHCAACGVPFANNQKVFTCTHSSCGSSYCIDCDIYIHETLHSCPNCVCLS